MDLASLAVPIVLAPIAGPGTPALTAAVSNAGGLGIHPCAYLAPDQIRAQTAQIRRATERAFGLNLFVETTHSAAPERLARAHERLRVYRDELGIPHPHEAPLPPDHYAEQLEAVLEVRPALFSFTFGIVSSDVLARARELDIFTLGTATTVDEAIALERAGVDAICAQGAEAGAHRGTFLSSVDASLIGTLALVPQIVDAVRIPVIASGGIGDGRGVAAALALGAAAVQLGSAFLLADEAATPPAYRESLRSAAARTTTLTTAFSGRAARGIANRVLRELGAEPEAQAPYPYQNALTRDIRTAAAAAGNADYLSLWAGQAVALARSEPAAEIVHRVMREARAARDASSIVLDRSDTAERNQATERVV